MLQSLIFAAPTFLASPCVTPSIKCTKTSSTVHVLFTGCNISILVFKKINFGSKTFFWKPWWNCNSFPRFSPIHRSVGTGRREPWEWGCQGTDKIWSYNKVLLYWGSFPYISLLLWKRKLFLILRTLLYKGSFVVSRFYRIAIVNFNDNFNIVCECRCISGCRFSLPKK